jgi:hypothetical protein
MKDPSRIAGKVFRIMAAARVIMAGGARPRRP